jgi:RNA polymerase sigma-70 factor (ECF subfamily)
MIDVTRTTTALLDGLHEPGNEQVWAELDARYRPILVAFARRLGLGDADAADVAQEAMLRFLQEYRDGHYDRERGRLRSWLLSIARTRVAAVYRRRRAPARGDSALGALPDDATLSEIWESERRAVILREALERLRTTTRTSDRNIRTFELLVVRRMPAASVAKELGISVDDVYVAKSRVAERLRRIIEELERAYDETGT